MATTNNIFETRIANELGTKSILKSLVNFLVNNPRIVMDSHDVSTLWEVKSPTKTLLTEIFDLVRINPAFQKDLTFVIIPPKIPVPEMLSYGRFMPIDLYQLKYMVPGLYDDLERRPEFKDKIIINVTSLIDQSGRVKNVPVLQNMIAYALLVRLYYSLVDTKTSWLPTNMITYATRVFGTLFATKLSDKGLSPGETAVVNAIASYYFLGQNLNSEVNDFGNILIARQDLTHYRQECEAVFTHIHSLYGYRSIQLEELVNVLRTCGIPLIERAVDDRLIFNLMARGTHSEAMLSSLSVEYPPAWMYILIESLTPLAKTGLIFTMKQRLKSLIGNTSQSFVDAIRYVDVNAAIAKK